MRDRTADFSDACGCGGSAAATVPLLAVDSGIKEHTEDGTDDFDFCAGVAAAATAGPGRYCGRGDD